jgi:hypothetical protein
MACLTPLRSFRIFVGIFETLWTPKPICLTSVLCFLESDLTSLVIFFCFFRHCHLPVVCDRRCTHVYVTTPGNPQGTTSEERLLRLAPPCFPRCSDSGKGLLPSLLTRRSKTLF